MSRVLLVSLGSIGRRHLRNARELLPGAEIAVYRTHFNAAGETPEGADRCFVDLDAALDFRPRAVIIASPASAHVAQALAFLEAGAHLFIEKPLAASSAGVDRLLAACRGSDRFVMVGYVLRFQPVLQYIDALLRAGEIGEVRTANVQVGQYLPDWRPGSDYRQGVSARRALGGGALLELSHELDYATWWFGAPGRVLCSSGALGGFDIDVEDSACVVLEYGAGGSARRVVVQVDFLQRVANMAVQVVGSEATLYADLIAERVTIVAPGGEAPRVLDAPRQQSGNEMYLRQFDFFFSRAIDGYAPRFAESAGFEAFADVDSAARVLRLVDVARESARLGRRLDFAADGDAHG